jgi:hypothetical protein
MRLSRFGHLRGIEGLQGPTEGVIVALFRNNAGRHQAVGGLMLEKPGDEVERLIDQPQAIEHHRFDRFIHGEVPQFRVLWRGLVDDVAHAEFVEHASDKAKVVQDLATVRGLIGIIISSDGEEILRDLPRNTKNTFNGRGRCGKSV